MRKLNKLSARAAATISKPGRHSDGGGLYLFISKDGAAIRRRWTFRWSRDGQTRELGLGSASVVSLARARELAAHHRDALAKGLDPLAAREAERRVREGRKTFGQAADAFLEAKEHEWRNAKHRAQWAMTLTRYAAPLRETPIAEVDTAAVLAVLQPLWQAKPETASRLRGRIEAVLDAARVQGWRQGENPARWKGHLDHLLAKPKALARGHHAALPHADVPAFVAELRKSESVTARVLEFTIMTAARSGEALGARWSEFDLEAKVWTVPALRMKAGREHRVPLSSRVLKILEALAEAKAGDFVFPGQKPSKPLSDMAMEMLLRRMKVAATVHGFRSAFRDWAGDCTSFPRELAEAALSHVIGDKAEQAYRRGDALEKRRRLMQAWADYLEDQGAVELQWSTS